MSHNVHNSNGANALKPARRMPHSEGLISYTLSHKERRALVTAYDPSAYVSLADQISLEAINRRQLSRMK